MARSTPTAPPAPAVKQALKKTFGLRALRPGQQQVIERVLAGRSTLAIMPTGAGKSLCYQLPALLLPGRTLVVSPLIALMKDQCEGLRALGVAAVQLNSTLNAAETAAAEAAVADGSARIVLTTPERLTDPAFLALLLQAPTSLLVVDEAHCISHWGHDFRPAFLEIAAAREALGIPVVLALTATATADVADDIARQLGIARRDTVHTGSYRENLDFAVETVATAADKPARVRDLVAAHPGSGLVYTATVKAAEELHALLRGADESVGLYHGRLPAAERRAQQDAFMDGRTRVMVATNAFGLGIDKADIRWVLHHQMPAGLDAYYQEAGRAGRDGQRAECLLLFQRSDSAVQKFFMAGRYPTADDAQAVYRRLHDAPPAGGWTPDALAKAEAAESDRPASKLRVAASLLRRAGTVLSDARGALSLARRGLDITGLTALLAAYREKRAQDQAALERMVDYAQTGGCRWSALLEHFEPGSGYFGDGGRCGHCDNCRRIAAAEKDNRRTAAAAPAEAAARAVLAQAARSAAETAPASAAIAPPPLAAGDTVRVKRYGEATVLSADSQAVLVRCADGKRRSFHPNFVERVVAQAA